MADRVVLGLIPSAEASFEAAIKALNPLTGGVMHIHENVSSKHKDGTDENEELKCNYFTGLPSCNKKLKQKWLHWAIKTAQKIEKLILNVTFKNTDDKEGCSSRKIEIAHIERVKSYAPHVDHLVLDLKCFCFTKPL